MKKLKGILALVALIGVTVSSCKKDDSGTNPSGSGAATVTASNYGFDGAASTTFKSTAAGIVQVGNVFTLTAVKDGSSESITIILNGVTATGTFDLLQGNSAGHGAIISKDFNKPADGTLNYSTNLPSSTSVKGGGSITINKLTSTEAEGTFYLVAHNSAGKDAFVEQGTFKGAITKR